MEELIRLENVSKAFGEEQVLDSCTVYFEAGRIYGIVGRNGSGKSVLMKLICGLYRPDSGTVEVLGQQVGGRSGFAKELGALIEAPGFLHTYSGFQNLKFLAQIQKKIGDEEIRAAMEQVGLDWRSRKWVGKYSMGMKQRLGIAQAIMEDPKILLLDEPTNGLDEGGVAMLRALLTDLKRQGKLILLASHVREEIEQLCDVVYRIGDGRLERFSK